MTATLQACTNHNLIAIDTSDLDPDVRGCSICFEPMNPANQDRSTPELHGPARLRRCGHIFGNWCIRQWLEVNLTCPQCRAPLFEAPAELQRWRDDRARILSDMRDIVLDFSQQWLPAQRLREFVLRNTNVNEVPSAPMRTLIRNLALNPGRMTSTWIEGLISTWDGELDRQSFPAETRQGVQDMQRLLALDILRHAGM